MRDVRTGNDTVDALITANANDWDAYLTANPGATGAIPDPVRAADALSSVWPWSQAILTQGATVQRTMSPLR